MESKYFDVTKEIKAAKRKAAEQRKRQREQGGPASKRRRAVGANAGQEHVEDIGSSDSDSLAKDGTTDPTCGDREHVERPVRTIEGKLLPSAASMSMDEYEKAAMNVFINAASSGLCRRHVANEYFQNNLASKFFARKIFKVFTLI